MDTLKKPFVWVWEKTKAGGRWIRRQVRKIAIAVGILAIASAAVLLPADEPLSQTMTLYVSEIGENATLHWVIVDHLADDGSLLNRQMFRWVKSTRPGIVLNERDSIAYDPRNYSENIEYDPTAPFSSLFLDETWVPQRGPEREGNKFSAQDVLDTAYRYFIRQQGLVDRIAGQQLLPKSITPTEGMDIRTITREQANSDSLNALLGVKASIELADNVRKVSFKPLDWKLGTVTTISTSGTEGFVFGTGSPFTCDNGGIRNKAGRHTGAGDGFFSAYFHFDLTSIADTDEVSNVDGSTEVTVVTNTPIIDIEPYGANGNIDHSVDSCDTHESSAEGDNTKDYVTGSTLFQSTGIKSGIDLGTQADADVKSAFSGNDFSLVMNAASGLGTFNATDIATLAHSTAQEWQITITHFADTQVVTPTDGDIDKQNSLWGPYWSDISTAIIVFEDPGDDLATTRTTDKGSTWSETTQHIADVNQVAVWYDKETPGDTGTLVHMAWLDSTAQTLFYQTIDVADGSLGTRRTVQASLTVDILPELSRLAITKAVNGNLMIAFSTQTEIESLRSTDSGANWTDRADPYETAIEEDYLLLFPANVDAGDVAGIFWDRSANEISIKMYDDSANTWTETSIATSMTDDTLHINMDGSVRHSDNHILFAAHSNDNSTTDDLLTWDLTVDSIASPTVTAKTNIFTNQNAAAQVSVFINQQNDDVYVAYLKGGTWQETVDVVYHLSTDDMANWAAESAYSQAAADDLRRVQAGRTVGDAGGRYQPVWFDDDDLILYVNENNDIEIVAVVAGGRRILWPQ